MLNGARILIAEDQSYIALDLALAVEDAGGVVVGPAASVTHALHLLTTQTVAAAILDLQLVGGECWAIVEVLTRRHTPTILQTGAPLASCRSAQFPDLVVLAKPCGAARLVSQLEGMIDRAGEAPTSRPRGGPGAG